jgi:hypothetical protein
MNVVIFYVEQFDVANIELHIFITKEVLINENKNKKICDDNKKLKLILNWKSSVGKD